MGSDAVIGDMTHAASGQVVTRGGRASKWANTHLSVASKVSSELSGISWEFMTYNEQ